MLCIHFRNIVHFFYLQMFPGLYLLVSCLTKVELKYMRIDCVYGCSFKYPVYFLL